MSNDRINALLSMLDRGQDSALLRFSLGSEYASGGDPGQAVEHLRRAVEIDRNYSAAWKLLGRSLAQLGLDGEAIAAYREGIGIAEKKGDRQAAREMAVFLNRLLKKGKD